MGGAFSRSQLQTVLKAARCASDVVLTFDNDAPVENYKRPWEILLEKITGLSLAQRLSQHDIKMFRSIMKRREIA